MRCLLCLLVGGLAACWAGAGPVQDPPPGEGDCYDVVHFGDARPVFFRLHISVDGRPLATLWDEHVTRVFKYLDVDGNGALNRLEVQRLPPLGVLFSAGFDSTLPTLNQLDTNNDGQVTRNELAGYFRRQGALPFQVSGGGRRDAMIEAQIELLRARELALEARIGGLRPANAESVNDSLFKLLDANGDGKLSKEELAAADAVLLKRDRNDDEIITPDELTPGAAPGTDDRLYQLRLLAEFELLQAEYAMRRGRGGNGPFWLLHPGASRAELARRLKQLYTPGSKNNQPPPTKLSRNDLGLDPAAFAQLDVDGDGLLDAEELARFTERLPDLELRLDLGRNASIQLIKRRAPLEASVRAGKEGTLMVEMNGTRLDLKALVAVRVDQAQGRKQEVDSYLKGFKEADRDNNGYLDMAEAMRSGMYRNLFRAMDRDGDGMIFEKEVVAYLETFHDLRASSQLSCATVGITASGKGLFELLDSNGDGRLSVREVRNAFKLIAELDRDSDGLISRTEIPLCSQATFRLGSASNDAVVRRGRRSGIAAQPANQPAGPEWFRKMDRNGDGDVSRKEFLGTDEQFRAIDSDGDGLISIAEAEAYESKQQKPRDRK